MDYCGDESELPGIPGKCGARAVFELHSHKHPSISFLCPPCVAEAWNWIDRSMIGPIDSYDTVDGMPAGQWLDKL